MFRLQFKTKHRQNVQYFQISSQHFNTLNKKNEEEEKPNKAIIFKIDI